MYHQQPNEGGDGGGGPTAAIGGLPRPDGALNTGAASVPLEDRLRNMILTNSESRPVYNAPPGLNPNPNPGTPPANYGYPATTTAAAAAPTTDGSAMAGAIGSAPPPASPKSSRKRLNQAQRRQMSAQLSIPINPRPSPPNSAGNYISPPPYGNNHSFHHPHQQHNQHPHHNQYQHHNQHQQHGQYQGQHGHHQQRQTAQRPQSATMRPSHYGHSPMPLTGQNNGSSYPSQPRHQQSLSYQGPMMYDDPYNWRSHQSHQSHQSHHQQSMGSFDAQSPRSARQHHHHHNNSNHSQSRLYQAKPEEIQAQATLLEHLCEQIVSSAEIEPSEIQEKEQFRFSIERLCQQALAKYELEVNNRADFPPQSARLLCFGSLSSGFATKASDMDLGLISPLSMPLPDFPKSPIPRLIEKAFLDAGLGARLLSRTRVPIIKLCEKPPEQLRLDLLDERAKWERGLLPEHDGPEVDEDAVDEIDPALARAAGEVANGAANGGSSSSNANGNGHANDDSKAGHSRKESVLDGPVDGDRYKQILAHLKQPYNQTLGNYYANAKRILRKLDGRDITHSTAREFKEKDLKILTDVCHAFVNGLADSKLQARLFASHSLSTSYMPSQLNYRSLYGVYMQAEGEALAMLWDTREIHEKDAHHENEAMQKLKQFHDVQNRTNFAIDLLGYNKEMQLQVENLRKIASLQVVTLEQGQFETATQYHDRAGKILFQVGGRDAASPNNIILPVVIKHYIAGIWSQDIREQVDAFSQTLDKPSLRAVARRHKSLQLALEFEKALAKNCYNEETAKQVQAYVDVLRLPLEKCDLPGRRFDYVVARTPETAPVISLARQLVDPSKLAPNQPRDPYRDRLEFPKTGAGVQCDINFSAHLALQNTALLRCYSHTDSRVRPLVLFVKHWAKMRGINTAYRGTLSSYGYVLMMLHYLVNIAQPFVCPNLQQLARPAAGQGAGPSADAAPGTAPGEVEDETVTCKGRDVRFWREEEEIKSFAAKGMITQNTDSIGHLLRGFFEYYAQSNFMSTVPSKGFDWGRDVLSLRTPGGLRSKQEKGWTGARTVMEVQNQATTPPAPPTPASETATPLSETPSTTTTARPAGASSPVAATTAPAKPVELKEVKHRYLFAIEDPFELEHNVARTVTHSGIVAIRDEFRRAWRIIKNLGKVGGVGVVEENLLDDVTDIKAKERDVFGELLNEIHGPELAL
ncbi:hypothetical protein SEUCBS139899_007556 [Sporothrix eucalyptigena]|uniref:polynucleotide adenylyltransferase n=1 Tax=Sporothrix eucalyptigena TaxID=1812306 RepID=A0ABP0CCB3_9PEZI